MDYKQRSSGPGSGWRNIFGAHQSILPIHSRSSARSDSDTPQPESNEDRVHLFRWTLEQRSDGRRSIVVASATSSGVSNSAPT